MSHECSRCGDGLDNPVEDNAAYVVDSETNDFVETEPREVPYAMKHTQRTRQRAQKIANETGRSFDEVSAAIASPNAEAEIKVHVGNATVEGTDGSTVETAQFETRKFSMPQSEFDHERVDSPNVVQHDADVARTYTQVEEVEVRKTGLVCGGCLDPDADVVAWNGTNVEIE